MARSPLAWHVASLLGGGALILWLQRGQWFFFDEWAFLEPHGPGLFEPHVGHWSTAPLLIFHGLRDTFGLGSYLPFAAAVTLVHLAVAHLVWRLCLRAGADAWLATLGALVVIVMGTGAENILWAFQIGFLGGLALGLLAFLLATSPTLGRGRLAAVTGISLVALTWSGTAIPIVAAIGAVMWHRHGRGRAVAFVAICGTVYVTWYVLAAVGSPHNPGTGGLGLHKVFVAMPEFLGVMLLLGWQGLFPVFGIGAAVLVALAWWLVRLARRHERVPGLSVPLILASAAALFALATAYSRAEWSVGSGRSSRYVYVLVVLLMPLCLVALTRLVRGRSRGWTTGALAALGVVATFQVVVLVGAAADQSEREQGSRRLIMAALESWEADPSRVDLSSRPDSEWAPDVTLGDLVELHERGLLPVGGVAGTEKGEARESPGDKSEVDAVVASLRGRHEG